MGHGRGPPLGIPLSGGNGFSLNTVVIVDGLVGGCQTVFCWGLLLVVWLVLVTDGCRANQSICDVVLIIYEGTVEAIVEVVSDVFAVVAAVHWPRLVVVVC